MAIGGGIGQLDPFNAPSFGLTVRDSQPEEERGWFWRIEVAEPLTIRLFITCVPTSADVQPARAPGGQPVLARIDR